MRSDACTHDDGLIRETTTLREVKELNPHLNWSKGETAGLADDALVDVVRRCTPFGTFLLHVRPHAL